MNRLLVPIVLAVLGVPTLALAQMEAEPESDYFTDEGAEDPDRSVGPRDLASARESGRGIILGGHTNLGRRSMPDAYTVRRGDTLWDITGRFFGNPWRWPRVWSFNPEVTNPHWIYPLDQLRLVPEGEAAQATLPESRLEVTQGRQPRASTIFLREQGYLDAEALEAAGVISGSPEEHMLLSNSDEVYIRFDSDEGVQPGAEFTVFRRMQNEERHPSESGELVRVFGSVQIRSYDSERKVARATITESLDPIERGFGVAAMPRRFDLIEPRTNDRDLEGKVVAALRPTNLLAAHQVIFLDRGSEQGVQVGNRFFVIREGDTWRQNLTSTESYAGARVPVAGMPEYPEEIVAEVRVITVRPNTCGAMVTRSLTDVTLGDRVQMREGY